MRTLYKLPLLLILWAAPGALIVQVAKADAVGAWGNNSNGQTAPPLAAWSGVIAIAAGWAHTVALKSDGTVLAWGKTYDGTNAVVADVPVGLVGVKTIAAGSNHTVALRDDGSVVAWGDNTDGQTTVPIEAQNGVASVAAGENHTVALKKDGSVVAWGGNFWGQTTTPAGLSGVIAIAAGFAFTVALKSDGTVVAWGNNQWGQTSVPAGLSGVTAIAAGGQHTVALKNDGSVVAWGLNENGQTTVPVEARRGVTAIAAGWAHTVALKDNGTVVAWGYNFWGQVTGTPKTDVAPFSAIASAVTLGSQILSGVTAIAAGSYHTVVLATPIAPRIITQPESQVVNEWRSASFTVTATGFPLEYQWRKDGEKIEGATGATYELTRTQTNQAGSYTVIVSSPAGSVTSAPPTVLTVNAVAPGSVVGWGADWAVPWTVPVAAQSGVTAIAAGYFHNVALKNDGTLVAWGALGQMAVPVAAQSGVIAIAAGYDHTVAVKSDGTLVAWGSNDYGEVTGTPPTDNFDFVIASPVTLGGQVLSGVTAVAGGHEHTVALKNDGSVVAWGSNFRGQVTGTPTTDPSFAIASPVTLGGQVLSGVMAIAAGAYHTVALKKDGSVVAWGNNDAGETTVPAGLSGVTAIAAAGECTSFGCSGRTVAVKKDGSVIVWGDFGRTDVPVAAQSGVRAIAAGRYHTVVVKNDGSVVSWGSFDPLTVPAGLKGVTAIAAGDDHTIALLGTVLPLPFLSAKLTANALILSWPTNAVGFTLQSTLNLNPPITWVDSTTSLAVIGGQFTVTNTISGPSRLYRLSKPPLTNGASTDANLADELFFHKCSANVPSE